jgi:hypothetical protein
MSKPKCPRCKRKGNEYRPGVFKCPLGHIFDNVPGEGGDYHEYDPSRRLEREEEMSQARQFNDSTRGGASRGYRHGGRG